MSAKGWNFNYLQFPRRYAESLYLSLHFMT
jgi:hypothetical protein